VRKHGPEQPAPIVAAAPTTHVPGMRDAADMTQKPPDAMPPAAPPRPEPAASVPAAGQRPKEIGGPAAPEPTRYGDWERKGRCIDF